MTVHDDLELLKLTVNRLSARLSAAEAELERARAVIDAIDWEGDNYVKAQRLRDALAAYRERP